MGRIDFRVAAMLAMVSACTFGLVYAVLLVACILL